MLHVMELLQARLMITAVAFYCLKALLAVFEFVSCCSDISSIS